MHNLLESMNFIFLNTILISWYELRWEYVLFCWCGFWSCVVAVCFCKQVSSLMMCYLLIAFSFQTKHQVTPKLTGEKDKCFLKMSLPLNMGLRTYWELNLNITKSMQCALKTISFSCVELHKNLLTPAATCCPSAVLHLTNPRDSWRKFIVKLFNWTKNM